MLLVTMCRIFAPVISMLALLLVSHAHSHSANDRVDLDALNDLRNELPSLRSGDFRKEEVASMEGTVEGGNEIWDAPPLDLPPNSAPPPPHPVSCKDPDGQVVPWWIVYKLPKMPLVTDPHLKEGSAHFFLLPGKATWERSRLAINDSGSMVGLTLAPLLTIKAQADSLAVVLYNDQPPDGPPTLKDGHTKGVVLGTREGGGLWLLHSIPHFPKVTGSTFSLDYPPGGLENGQMLFCMGQTLGQLDEVVGGLLGLTRATFYNSSIPRSLVRDLPKLVKVVVDKGTTKGPPFYANFSLPLPHLPLTVLAKGPKFHREMFADWIAPAFKASLLVQSWSVGAHPLPSNCTPHSAPHVLNILSKRMEGLTFSYTNDHSKWAVSPSAPLVCIADLNRMKPQKGRGGVAVCLEDEGVVRAFRELVLATEPCPAPTKLPFNFSRRHIKKPSSYFFTHQKQRQNKMSI